MRKFIFLVLLLFAILLEGSLTTLPIVFDLLLIFYIFQRKAWIFFVAFLAGIFLDVVLIKTLGVTSLFYILTLFVAALYEKKFEIATIPFVLMSSFLGSLAFLFISRNEYILVQSIVSSLFSILLFSAIKFVTQRRIKEDF